MQIVNQVQGPLGWNGDLDEHSVNILVRLGIITHVRTMVHTNGKVLRKFVPSDQRTGVFQVIGDTTTMNDIKRDNPEVLAQVTG